MTAAIEDPVTRLVWKRSPESGLMRGTINGVPVVTVMHTPSEGYGNHFGTYVVSFEGNGYFTNLTSDEAMELVEQRGYPWF